MILLLLACGLDQIAPPDRPSGPDQDTGCGVDWGWDILDSSGSCTACTAGEYFTFEGTATNTCGEEEFFKTNNSCLIDSVVVKERGGSGTTVFQVSGECVPDDQTWALNPQETVREELDAPQPLGAGEYILEINFGDTDSSVAGAPFSVQ